MEDTLASYKEALKQGKTAQMMRLDAQLDDTIFNASQNKRLRAH